MKEKGVATRRRTGEEEEEEEEKVKCFPSSSQARAAPDTFNIHLRMERRSSSIRLFDVFGVFGSPLQVI